MAPELEREIIDRIKRKYGMLNKRTGTHLSDLIYCITKSYWTKVSPAASISDEEALLFAIGLGLETVLLEDRTSTNRPDPVDIDGVLMSIDTVMPIANIASDLKSTRLGWKADELEPGRGIPQGWVKQMMGYSYAIKRGAVPGDVEKLVYGLVAYLVIPAQLRGRKLLFTESELDEFWQWVLERKAVLERALEAGLPPQPFYYTESQTKDDWQCQRCPMQMLCAGTLSMGNYLSV